MTLYDIIFICLAVWAWLRIGRMGSNLMFFAMQDIPSDRDVGLRAFFSLFGPIMLLFSISVLVGVSVIGYIDRTSLVLYEKKKEK